MRVLNVTVRARCHGVIRGMDEQLFFRSDRYCNHACGQPVAACAVISPASVWTCALPPVMFFNHTPHKIILTDKISHEGVVKARSYSSAGGAHLHDAIIENTIRSDMDSPAPLFGRG
jgi:hypothetical protein